MNTVSAQPTVPQKAVKTPWEKPQIKEIPIFFEVSLYAATK